MPLDPQAKAYLDKVAAIGLSALDTVPVAQGRADRIALQKRMAGPIEPVAHVANRTIPGPASEIPVRVYRPGDGASYPILVYLHGGGWVVGNLDSHDVICRALANMADCVVLSVDYRMSPEVRFPAPLDDCFAATVWASKHGAEIGGDGDRIAVGGDSAGGNLAAAVALQARDRGGPRIAYQLLIYPVTEAAFETESYVANAEGYGLTRAAMIWFWDQYVVDPEHRRNPYAAPLLAADLTGLPPAIVITAEYDVLRDEGIAYAKRLAADGVAVEERHDAGMIHGFVSQMAHIDRGREAMAQAAASLKKAFGVVPAGVR